MSWIVQPAGMDNLLHQVGGLNNLSTMLSKSYPMYETFEKGMNMSRLGLSNQGLMQSALKSGDLRVASLRPKTEPSSLCEGEDEAQSIPKAFDYGSLFHNDEAGGDDDNVDPSSPLQSSTGGTELSCLSSENMNFTFKYRLQDVTAPVDSALGQEILWAY
jgi:hypothetical protein